MRPGIRASPILLYRKHSHNKGSEGNSTGYWKKVRGNTIFVMTLSQYIYKKPLITVHRNILVTISLDLPEKFILG